MQCHNDAGGHSLNSTILDNLDFLAPIAAWGKTSGSLKRLKSFDRQVELWLADDYAWPARWRRAIAGVMHNRVPRQFRPMPVLHWLSRQGLASTPPFILLYYGTIGFTTAYIAAGGLFIANAFVGFLGLAAEPKAIPDDAHAEAMVRFGDLLGAFKTGSVPAARKPDAIRACLGILEIYARRITKTSKGDVSVSLVQYAGSSSTKLKILHRNPGNLRPVDGREFDGRYVLGHHACQHGARPCVVHQLNHFGRHLQSPTQSRVEYKSIFFIPIEATTAGGGVRVKGFVSIDCKRPYAFYGNRSREISVTCRPIVDHLKDLLRENG